MTATVIPLSSRRRNQSGPCHCPRCQVSDLLTRVEQVARTHDGELLIPGTALTDLAEDVLTTITAAVDHPDDERPSR